MHDLDGWEAELPTEREDAFADRCSLPQQLCTGEVWQPWLPLSRTQREEGLPTIQGLYRIRIEGHAPCVYIGETENFRRRLDNELGGSLRAKTMPDGEHHTAAPGLWHLQQAYAASPLQVSLAPLSGVSPHLRKGLESLAIALERCLYRRSPMLNYGRMPDGLSKPKRPKARQDRDYQNDESAAPACDLLAEAHAPTCAPHWGGHRWSEWTPVSHLKKEKDQGLYRLRRGLGGELALLGHGNVANVAQFDKEFQCSYVPGEWTKGQRRELLDDLIGLYLVSHKRLPLAQFVRRDTGMLVPSAEDRHLLFLQRVLLLPGWGLPLAHALAG